MQQKGGNGAVLARFPCCFGLCGAVVRQEGCFWVLCVGFRKAGLEGGDGEGSKERMRGGGREGTMRKELRHFSDLTSPCWQAKSARHCGRFAVPRSLVLCFGEPVSAKGKSCLFGCRCRAAECASACDR